MSIENAKEVVDAGIEELRAAPIEPALQAWRQLPMAALEERAWALAELLVGFQLEGAADLGALALQAEGQTAGAQQKFRAVSEGSTNPEAERMLDLAETARDLARDQTEAASGMAEQAQIVTGLLASLGITIGTMKAYYANGLDAVVDSAVITPLAIRSAEAFRDAL